MQNHVSILFVIKLISVNIVEFLYLFPMASNDTVVVECAQEAVNSSQHGRTIEERIINNYYMFVLYSIKGFFSIFFDL